MIITKDTKKTNQATKGYFMLYGFNSSDYEGYIHPSEICSTVELNSAKDELKADFKNDLVYLENSINQDKQELKTELKTDIILLKNELLEIKNENNKLHKEINLLYYKFLFVILVMYMYTLYILRCL